MSVHVIDDVWTAAVALAAQSPVPVAVAVLYTEHGTALFACQLHGLPECTDFEDDDVQDMVAVTTCIAANRYGRRALQEVAHGNAG